MWAPYTPALSHQTGGLPVHERGMFDRMDPARRAFFIPEAPWAGRHVPAMGGGDFNGGSQFFHSHLGLVREVPGVRTPPEAITLITSRRP